MNYIVRLCIVGVMRFLRRINSEMDFLLKHFSIPSLIFLGVAFAIMIYLSYLLWWEHWGQWMFNRIIIVDKKIKEEEISYAYKGTKRDQ